MSLKKHPGLKVIDHWLNYQLAQGDIPGFQVSIRLRGDLSFSKAYGYADLKNKEQYTRAHLGRIASQSKTFTGALTLWLNSRGQIDLNEHLVNILTEFKNHKDPKFKRIKIIDLLTHRSGIFRDSIDTDYWGKREPFLTRTDLTNEIASSRLIYSPGLFTKYSNLGYGLLGLALERCSGKKFATLIREFFAEKDLDSNIIVDSDINGNFSHGYLRRQMHGQKFKQISHRTTQALCPAAGFCSNTDSTTDFFHKLYLTSSILPKQQRTLLHSKKWPVKNMKSEYYGIGTIFTDVAGDPCVGHSGGFPGFASQTWVELKTKRTYGFIANTSITKTFNAIQSMAVILRAIDNNFPSSSWSSLIVSKPLADNYTSTVYVIGKSKALAIPLTGWMPADDLMIFSRYKNHYLSNQICGYKNVGEPLTFNIKDGTVIAAQFGGFVSKIAK
ncbi:MAG: beta-lactamase family protein [Bdellovibrionales bacterium]|nr:beta-lactamase family protein [Bdellovibrionales bacterium]